MKRVVKLSSLVLASIVAEAQTALAKVCPMHQSEAPFAVTQNTSLGQFFLLGIMLTLVTSIFLVKWVWRNETASTGMINVSLKNDPLLENLRQLKIGTRFSNWSTVRRLTDQK